MPLDAFRKLLEAVEVKAWAIILYLAGLSTRAMTKCYGFVKASREAVRLWVHKLESLAYHGPPKPRRLVTIDETKVKLNGEWLYLWAAIDADKKEGNIGYLRLLAEIKLKRPHIP